MTPAKLYKERSKVEGALSSQGVRSLLFISFRELGGEEAGNWDI